ncbi:MAG: hypothetical protein PUC37_04850 [Spirochaetales bacterium]|nr:hypothetical protein [Spirochaetales bacterium]
MKKKSAAKKTIKYQKKIISNVQTYKLMMLFDLTLISFSLIMLLLYIVGNYQTFLDTTQKIILTTLSYSSLLATAISIILVLETFIKIFTEKKHFRNIINLIFLIASIIICLIELGFSSTINFVSAGL